MKNFNLSCPRRHGRGRGLRSPYGISSQDDFVTGELKTRETFKILHGQDTVVGPLSTVVGPQGDSGRQQAYCGPPPLYFQVSSIKLISFDDIYESLDQIARLNLHQEQFLAIGADH